ncbi:MAG: hypothetical protein PSX36_08485, partial [bacterium]|nr:hypothetical protein [bacterium]
MRRAVAFIGFLLLFWESTRAQCVNSCSVYATSTIAFAPINAAPHNTINFGGCTDDCVSSPIPLGFNFTFFCHTYTAFVVSTNGFLSFDPGSGAGCCAGQILPDPSTPNNVIAFNWTDLNLYTTGVISYSTVGVAPNRKCVVTYSNIANHNWPSSPLNTGQIILYETINHIEVHTTIINIDPGTRACTQGIEDTLGLNGYASPGCNSSTFSMTNTAYRFWSGGSPITPAAILGSNNVCSGTAQVYSVVPSPGATSYVWNLPAGWTGTSTTNTISVIPSATGILSVSATNSCNPSPKTTRSITIKSSPSVIATPSSQAICAGDSYSVTASGAVTYTWSSGSTNTVITGSPAANITRNVIGTAANGCTDIAVATITVNALPVLTITPSSTVICSGKTVTLTGTGASTYSWTSGPINSIY